VPEGAIKAKLKTAHEYEIVGYSGNLVAELGQEGKTLLE
jgi:hypothetical protein